jgi:hypothetical protein
MDQGRTVKKIFASKLDVKRRRGKTGIEVAGRCGEGSVGAEA